MKISLLRKSFALAAALTMLSAAAPLASAAGGVKIDKTSFPDAQFRKYVLASIDSDGDGTLSADEITSVAEINVMEKGISSLKGVENFTNLKRLYCAGNKISEIDLSKNKKLEELNVGEDEEFAKQSLNYSNMKTFGNKLTSLDVSMLPSLTALSCSNNQLTGLDVSKNTKLAMLSCSGNKLKELDLSKNKSLFMLYCGDNPLTSLDLSKCTMLSSLNVKNCKLTSLDLSANKQLGWLDCTGNKLEYIDISSTIIKSAYYKGDVSYEKAMSPDKSKKPASKPAAKKQSGKPVLTATAGKSSVKLEWTAVEGAEKYRVCKFDSKGKGKTVKETSSTGLTLKNLSSGEYRYAVNAYVNGKWTSTASSDIVTVKIK